MIISVREIGDVSVLDLPSEIRRSDLREKGLLQFVKAELEKGKRKLIFNFENVRFFDSYGIGEIIACHISVRLRGGGLKWACLSKKLISYINVCLISPPWLAWPDEDRPFESEEAALESFSRASIG